MCYVFPDPFCSCSCGRASALGFGLCNDCKATHTHTVRLTELLHGQHCGKPKQNHYKHFHLLNWPAAAGCKTLFHGSSKGEEAQRLKAGILSSLEAYKHLLFLDRNRWLQNIKACLWKLCCLYCTVCVWNTSWPQANYNLSLKAPLTYWRY